MLEGFLYSNKLQIVKDKLTIIGTNKKLIDNCNLIVQVVVL